MSRYPNIRLKGGFGQCTNAVMRNPDISTRDKAVYAYLCTYADSQNNQMNVSVFRMAAELNISKQTVIRSLKLLEEKKILARISRGRGKAKITMLLK